MFMTIVLILEKMAVLKIEYTSRCYLKKVNTSKVFFVGVCFTVRPFSSFISITALHSLIRSNGSWYYLLARDIYMNDVIPIHVTSIICGAFGTNSYGLSVIVWQKYNIQQLVIS